MTLPSRVTRSNIAARLDDEVSATPSKKDQRQLRRVADHRRHEADAERAGTWCRSFRRRSGAVGALRAQGF
jgi:hypothetical protein